MTRIEQAELFAVEAHQGQVRKYTGLPYVTHPFAVAEIVKTVDHTEEMIIASLLHDTVEDTDVYLFQIARLFGVDVSVLVYYTSEVSQKHHGNRAVRKAMDREHYARGPADSQTIKVADLIHNAGSIKKYDPKFWKVFREEKRALLNALVLADPKLVQLAYRIIEEE